MLERPGKKLCLLIREHERVRALEREGNHTVVGRKSIFKT